MRRWWSVIGGVALLVSASAQQSDVLFIGNSYTYVNDLPNTFRDLALSLGDTVNVAMAAPGGYTFQQHAGDAATLAAISSQHWDYVALQEQSQIPSFPPEQVEQECYPFATQLVDDILANDSCSQPVFYMTWGRQNGDADNCASWPPVCTYDGMQQRLRESYLEMAFANDAFAAPVGVAWKHVRDTHPLINLYNPDQSHPSAEGTYLAACVFYSTFFRQSSVGATFTATLDPDTAAILRVIASSTVLDSLSTWNIGVNDPDASFTYMDLGGGEALFSSPGDGEDTWLFPNDPYSTESNPTHQFPSLGSWTVTHVVEDACGRTDTSTQVVELSFTGVIDIAFDEPPYDVWAYKPGQVHVHGGSGREVLMLMDMTGRTMGSYDLLAEDMDFPCGSGMVAWRVVTREGKVYNGRFFAP